MPTKGKRYKVAAKPIEAERQYDPSDAVRLIKAGAKAKFDETIEIAVRLGVDPKDQDQQVRSTVVLPNGSGRKVRVLVFARGDKAKEAEAAGADYVGAEDLVERIQGGWTDFDVAIAAPDMMSQVGKLGRILGPRGLMPNPKAGTVAPDVGRAVKEVKAGKIEFRTDKAGFIHAPIGKASFEESALVENLGAIVDAIVKARPSAAKGVYLKKIAVTSTMGPSALVDVTKAQTISSGAA
ncbi:MAG: 50S ribosomal protein L1 [Armatimonadetes bacterium]|nr:50S ribosomal protein L1 [Armatimonadota bacterium]